MMEKKEKAQADFMEKATSAMPKWAWGALGTFIGIALTLQLTGYNSSLNRVIEAYVKRIEKSADNLEASAAKFDAIVKRMDTAEGRITAVERDIDALKKHQSVIDSKYHKGVKNEGL
jgi:exonuclease VII small subunit